MYRSSEVRKSCPNQEPPYIIPQLPRPAASLHGKLAVSVAIRVLAERFMVGELGLDGAGGFPSTHELIARCKGPPLPKPQIETLDMAGIAIPGIIHINAFMYEPIVDIGHGHLQRLFQRVRELGPAP